MRQAVGTTQSFGLSFWSTNMQMLEITIEKEQSKECAAQLFEIPISRKPKMDRLKVRPSSPAYRASRTVSASIVAPSRDGRHKEGQYLRPYGPAR